MILPQRNASNFGHELQVRDTSDKVTLNGEGDSSHFRGSWEIHESQKR
jgi:hypothetical protein